MTQRDRAALLRRLHDLRPLVLPNAWDAASARVVERAGARAVATTSAGVSWSCGRRDGGRLSRDEAAAAVRRIVSAVGVPVTADVEGGYGAGTAGDVADTVRAVVAAGAAGVNLEDAPGRGGGALLAPEEHAERVRAARQAAFNAGGDLVINARTDVYLAAGAAPETRFEEAVRRANRYLAAGADCVFVPGVQDTETIGALVRAVDGPVNVMVGPGAPGVADLGRLGVARVSVGPAIALAALAAADRAARELVEAGTYRALETGLSFGEADGLFADA